MKTTNRIEITGPFEKLFTTASNIARWPQILPHYRWVKILKRTGSDVEAEMAAKHMGLPLWWRTLLRPRPEEKRIYFTHTAGITKGMEVYWSFEDIEQTVRGPKWFVQIHHEFNPHWPPPGKWIAQHIIGERFVQEVANKTLERMKKILEDWV